MTIKNKMISACLMCLVVFSVVDCSPKRWGENVFHINSKYGVDI